MALHYKQNRTYLKNKRRHYSEVTENKEVLLKIVRVRLYCSLVICWVKWLRWSCVNIKRESTLHMILSQYLGKLKTLPTKWTFKLIYNYILNIYVICNIIHIYTILYIIYVLYIYIVTRTFLLKCFLFFLICW